jgi:ABC-2 type transport system permease protein
VAAQLVRLKLTLLANTFRRSVWQTIGLVLAAAYGMAVTVVVVAGAILGGTADPVLTGQLLTLGGAVAMLAWWVIPLFAFGLDATLDPQRFVTFAIPRRRLLAGLALAGLVSVPAAVTTLAALGVSLAWWSDPLALVGALLGAVLGVGLCIVGSRATTTALAPLLDSRRYREVLMVVAVVPLVLIGPAFGWLSANVEKTVDGAAVQVEVGATSSEAMSGAIAPLVDVVAWTPFGAPWAVGAAVHDGAWGLAAARVAVAAAVLLLAWVVWDRSLARALNKGDADGKRKKADRGSVADAVVDAAEVTAKVERAVALFNGLAQGKVLDPKQLSSEGSWTRIRSFASRFWRSERKK